MHGIKGSLPVHCLSILKISPVTDYFSLLVHDHSFLHARLPMKSLGAEKRSDDFYLKRKRRFEGKRIKMYDA